MQKKASSSIVDARLTPPTSRDDDAQIQDIPRDDDAPMPEAPAHDIATPRRQVGGRCRKWCISAQQTSDKRTCAACCMCGQQFGHGETRLQQWCSRNSHCAHVHAQCVNGSVAHDHELLPKHPTVQDVVETVVRQRECVNRAAAYPCPDSDQAPADDDQDLFGREEALRLDEEIMDFQLFDTVT